MLGRKGDLATAQITTCPTITVSNQIVHMDSFEAHKTNPNEFPQFSIKDTLFLHYSCPQREKLLQLYSKYIQLSFTLSGKRFWHHGNHTWEANTNNGLLIKKCAFIQELPADGSGWDVLVFYLKDEYLRSIFDEFLPHLIIEDLPEPRKEMIETFVIDLGIRNCYKGIIPYFSQDTPLPESVLEGKFKELLFLIFSHPKNKHILAYILKIKDGYQTPLWEVMEANFMYDLKLKDFANIANRSLSTFKRDFKDYYKMSPGRWLTLRRLERAKAIISTSDKSIQEIAFECGFNNASHFSRVFKEHFQHSPSMCQLGQ